MGTNAEGGRAAWRRFAAVSALGVGVAGLAIVLFGVGLRGSLPVLDGDAWGTGLDAPVQVERDALGVPTLTATSRLDVSFALGYLHAQERFFQMDILRRSGAGELAALFGAPAVEIDRLARRHRFRARAQNLAATLPHREHLVAYARGVNAGLAGLRTRPFEYWLLRARPEPWRPEDVLLTVFAMYLDLQSSDGDYESCVGVVHDLLPPALAAFLDARGTSWDAPLAGAAVDAPAVPGPEVVDLRRERRLGRTPVTETQPASELSGEQAAQTHRGVSPRAAWGLAAPADAEGAEVDARGSNNWAVDGAHTADGGALLAGDMHLGLMVPNIWYRASIVVVSAGKTQRVTGITLPGAPTIVAGSNGAVAWAYTNSEVDTADLVILDTDAAAPGHYRTPDGVRAFGSELEIIDVRGAADDTLVVQETQWGPVIDRDHRDRRRALSWIAHAPSAVNLGLLDLEQAQTVQEGIAIAKRTAIPAQNCVLGDSSGAIGWTLMGPVPRRFGWDGRTPQSWSDGRRGWDGTLASEEVPELVAPPRGRIWTANNRVVDGEALARIGDGGYAFGARAQQIRDALLVQERVTAADLLRLQLDDRALFLAPWRALMLETMAREAPGGAARRDSMRAGAQPDATDAPQLQLLRQLVEHWGGHAAVGSVGYRAVRDFRNTVATLVFTPLLEPCRAADARVRDWQLRQREGALWRLVQERPAHFVPAQFDSWEALLAAAVDSTLGRLQRQGRDLSQRTWGEVNTTRIQHPLSRAVPFLSRWLDMPAKALPGDQHMPRVQAPAAGASQRFVVSPGREAEGFFHMPCGQSGHPLSPFYRNGHRAWEDGAPTPFLPGETRHILRLAPPAALR